MNYIFVHSSDGYQDELAVAGVWLYRVTKEQQYLDNAVAAYNTGLTNGIEWNNKGTAAEVSQTDHSMVSRCCCCCCCCFS